MAEGANVYELLKSLGDEQRAERRSATNGSVEARPSVAQPGIADAYAAKAVGSELARLDDLPRPWHAGAGWDTTTFEVACNLIEIANSGWGYTLEQAQADLLRHAPRDDVWGPHEHAAKWNSARSRVGAAGRTRAALATSVTEVDAAEFGVTSLPADAEAAFWSERPILTHIHDSARARMVAPWGVLGVTLARVIALTPWTVHLPPIVGSRASLNFAVALVAASGGGKGGADGAAHDAIRMPSIPEFRIGSGEAIAHCLKHRQPPKAGGGTEWNTDDHNALLNLPEVDKLTAQAQRQGATIMPELRAAWSGEALGHITADASRRIPVEKQQYRLSLILGVQPGRAGGLLNDSEGGFPQRLIWLPAYDRNAPPRDQLPRCPKPIDWEPPRVSEFGAHGQQIEVCGVAVEEIQEARWRANRGEGDPLDGHLLLAREKVAAALGVLEGHYAITEDDWRLAGYVVRRSNAQRAAVQVELTRQASVSRHASGIAAAEREDAIAEGLADKALRRICPRILSRLGDHPDGWVTRKTIGSDWLASRDRKYRDEALERLIDTGQIVAEQTGENAYRYRLSGGR